MTNEPNDQDRVPGNFFDRLKEGYQTRLSNLIKYSFSGRGPNSETGITRPYTYSGWIFVLSVILFFMASLKGINNSNASITGFWELIALDVLLLLLLRRRAFFIFSSLSLMAAISYLIL